MFVREKGVFRRTYDLVLELPYHKIDEIRRIGDVLTLVEGEKTYVFKSGYADRIERAIKSVVMVPT